MATVDWSNLTVAGAFIVGAALGTIATSRIYRAVLDYMRRDAETHRRPK